jgi:hypothetical protein
VINLKEKEKYMSLDKAIKHGKEYRKVSKKHTNSCRNHGGCDYCQSNREHKNKKREEAANQKLNEYLNGAIN